MAYADRDNSGTRMVAVVVVIILMAVLGYAFITGLAYQYVKKVQEQLNTFDVAPPPPPPPPPPDEPPPPPDTPQPTSPPVVSPPVIVQTPAPPSPIVTTATPPPAAPVTVTAAPPAPVVVATPPAPPKPNLATRASIRGAAGDWFPEDYYPASAKREGIQGRVVVALTIGANGRVTQCSVTTSSGNGELDNTTCRLAKSNGRFNPAKDSAGNAIESSYTLPVRWQLRDE
ncbi:MAG: energy transducer TonB [Sphingomonas sp.]|nr:energy transducer TonB [Sphingomonas sp.]